MKKTKSLPVIKKDVLKMRNLKENSGISTCLNKIVNNQSSIRPVWTIGIDEVGRGPLAGPVTVCAFGVKISDMEFRHNFSKKYPGLKLNDSKKLSELQREKIVEVLKKEECEFLIKSKSAKYIDDLGISVCIHKLINELLKDFIRTLNIIEDDVFILLDGGLKAPPQFKNQETHIKGDAKFAVISCASILAKVYRDKYMTKLGVNDGSFLPYAFDVHKGYGTKKHIESIKNHGLSKEHRKSFCGKIKTNK